MLHRVSRCLHLLPARHRGWCCVVNMPQYRGPHQCCSHAWEEHQCNAGCYGMRGAFI